MSDSVSRRPTQNRLTPLLTALAVAGALLVPLAGAAQAQTLTGINARGEDVDTPVGKNHRIVVDLTDENSAVYVTATPVTINFEVDGPGDPNNDGFGGLPDETCTVEPDRSRCTGAYPAVLGEDTVRVWREGTPPDTTETQTEADNDSTDVVLRTGFEKKADTLNCTEKSTAEPGNNVTVACRINVAEANVLIDAAHLGGANDPGEPAGTADYNNVCTTDAFGACQAVIQPTAGNETGSANICFWVDEEGDGSYHPALNAEWDGAFCDTQGIDAPENQNSTDVVVVGWGNRRDVSISAPATTRTWGSRFAITGTVSSSEASCKPAVTVAVQRDVLGAPVNYVGWRQATTDANGNYRLTGTAHASANYRAVVSDDEACLGDVSGFRRVRVSKTVAMAASDRNVRRGQIVRISGTVKPCAGHAGDRVALLQRRGRAFRAVASAKTNARCKATFVRRINKTSVFKIRAAKTDPDHEAGLSRAVRIRAR